MEWQDQGVLLSMRVHGETAAIIEVFTAAHGRHLGVLPGGASRTKAAMLQPGSQIAVRWRARLEDHLGNFSAEPLAARAALLGDRRALAGLTSACALLHLALPERQAHDRLYAATLALFDALDRGDAAWPARYLAWEMLLLEDIGFGLDLTACAVSGANDDLAYVSPRTGRAVGRKAAGDWAARLFPLPQMMLGGMPSPEGLAQGLAITGHFLGLALGTALNGRPMPEARARLVALLTKG